MESRARDVSLGKKKIKSERYVGEDRGTREYNSAGAETGAQLAYGFLAIVDTLNELLTEIRIRQIRRNRSTSAWIQTHLTKSYLNSEPA